MSVIGSVVVRPEPAGETTFRDGSRRHGLSGLVAGVLLAMAVYGCTQPMYPATSGFHAPDYPGAQKDPQRIVIWSNNPAVSMVMMGWMQHAGHTVIERARLQAVLNEQKIRVTNTPDDDAYILRAGRLAGADYIIFAYVTIGQATAQPIEDDPRFGGLGMAGPTFHTSVSARSVRVATGEIRWSGTASYPRPIRNPEQAVTVLVEAAFARATCKTETGFEWNDQKGCIKKH